MATVQTRGMVDLWADYAAAIREARQCAPWEAVEAKRELDTALEAVHAAHDEAGTRPRGCGVPMVYVAMYWQDAGSPVERWKCPVCRKVENVSR